ncbi:MAG TPA: flippase [Gammaproteobacteria bacterium]|nr:flippase [Gammaproteobacteria bacterium]
MVQNERSIFRNTAFSTAGRGAGDLFGFLFLIVFARSFGSDALGEFSYAMAVGAILAMLVVPGVNSLLVREIAKAPAEGPRLVGAIAALKFMIAAPLFGGLLLLGGLLVDDGRARQILLIIGLYQLIHTLCTVFAQYFRARELSQYGAGLEAGHKALILLVGLAVIHLDGSAEITLLVYPLAAAAMYVAGFLLVQRHHAAPRPHLDLELSRRWVLASLPLFAVSAISVGQARGGIIFLGSIGDARDVGLFSAGDRLIAAASLLFWMFNGAVFPVMSRLSSSPAELDQLLVRCMRLTVTLVLPIGVAIALLREPIIALVFGRDFLPAADVLGILAFGLVIAALNGLPTMLMIACNWLRDLLYIQLLGLVVFVAAMAVLVPAQGFTGLAWSVLILKLTVSTASLAHLRRRGHAVPLWPMLRGPLAASAGMAAAFELSGSLPLAVQIGLAAAAGAILLFVFKGVEMHDLAYLRRILRKPA